MTESRNTSLDSDPASMNHQSKKKRVEDQPLPADGAVKPVQLQRRRVWRACESCRRKKIKCDGVEPTCSQCATSKSQCTWLQTKDRAALSRHYVQELEARLLHMESLFQQITPILEQVGQAEGLDLSTLAPVLPTNGAGSTGSVPNTSHPRNSNAAKEHRPNVTDDGEPTTPIKVEDDFSESFGQLALDEHGHLHWIGGSSTMSLIQSFRAITSSPLRRVSPMEEDPLAPGPSVNKLYFPASVFFGKISALPKPEEVEYPDRDLADKLVDAYFSRFHFLMPILDKPTFTRQYQYLMDHKDDRNLARKQTAFIAVVCAVFAVASRIVDDPRLTVAENLDDAGMGMVYYERALILQYISHASSQVEHVQCFLLMSSFLCAVNCLPQAWLLVGQAVRTAQDIGLHRSPRRLLVTPIEKETRRKIWWGVYMLDRMLAVALGRPLAIEDADCDVEIPVDVDDDKLPEYFQGSLMQSTPSLMRGFIELTTLYKIAGQVLRQVYSLDKCKDNLEPEKRLELQRAVDNLDKMLTKWCDNLPVMFKSQPVTEKQVSMGAVLCSHYYSILTTLHRNLLPVKRDQPVSPSSTAKAVSTARACIRLAPSIKNVVPPCHHLAFFIQNLFSSAVVILLYAMHATDPGASLVAMEEARSCLQVLESWEGHWPGARKCKELLEDLAATASEAIRNAANGQARVHTPASSSSSASPSMRPDSRVSAPGSMPVSERLIKGKPRRTRSRDVGLSPRQTQNPLHFRPDSQRARSTSRKRPHEEDLYRDGHSLYSSGLPSSYPGRSNLSLSSHSSPVSANSHPSPPGPVLEIPQDPGAPRLASSTSFSPVSMTQSPSVPIPNSRFDYDFGLSQSPSERWNGFGPDTNNNELKFFPSGSSQPQSQSQSQSQSRGSMAYSSAPFVPSPSQPSVDTSLYPQYDRNLGMGLASPTTVSGSPPLSGFAAPGLPFRGLDFIRNYNNAGYTAIPEDQLWQNFDTSAFGFDPDIPFDFSGENGQLWTNDING